MDTFCNFCPNESVKSDIHITIAVKFVHYKHPNQLTPTYMYVCSLTDQNLHLLLQYTPQPLYNTAVGVHSIIRAS